MSDHSVVTEPAPSYRSGFRFAIPLFLALNIVLALLGVLNQRQYGEQRDLMSRKEQLLADVAVARPRAAVVNGPRAIAAWATANGMVPIPEAREAQLIAPAPAPTFDDPLPSLELRTSWR